MTTETTYEFEVGAVVEVTDGKYRGLVGEVLARWKTCYGYARYCVANDRTVSGFVEVNGYDLTYPRRRRRKYAGK